jgi:transposase-like protein
VDKEGRTVDFLLSRRRDIAAAKRFFSRAVDKLKAAGRLPRRVRVRSSMYLNNVIEQDHRRIKQRI